jgi:PIN domain nuclease of toxin-antitoxin system
VSDVRGSILDASALLAYLQGEPGTEVVQSALADGAAISVVNYAEVLARLADAGEDPAAANRRLGEQGLVAGLLDVIEPTLEDAVTVARLRGPTRAYGLSLGDRFCLATGLRLRWPVLTADRSWTNVTVGVDIRLIRP